MEKLFRSLIIINAVLSTLFWSMPLIDYMWLSNDQIYLLDQAGFGAFIPNSIFVYWLTLSVWLALFLGLFFYIKVARTGYVIMAFVTFVISFFYGIQVMSPYEAALGYVITLNDGGIIAIAYLTSIGVNFEKSS